MRAKRARALRRLPAASLNRTTYRRIKRAWVRGIRFGRWPDTIDTFAGPRLSDTQPNPTRHPNRPRPGQLTNY